MAAYEEELNGTAIGKYHVNELRTSIKLNNMMTNVTIIKWSCLL